MEEINKQTRIDGKFNWRWSRILDIYIYTRTKKREVKRMNFRQLNLRDNKSYELVDTPGHQNFVRSMINGISSNVNIAIVILSMIENEFEASFNGGMLKEHLVLAKAIGIQNIIIVSNKMDVINWIG